MFQLQVTIIRQTFQYMDMTWSVLTVWGPILLTFAVQDFLNLDNKLLILSSLLSKCLTETCSKLYIIEYIVVVWLNDIFVSETTQRDGCYQQNKGPEHYGYYEISRRKRNSYANNLPYRGTSWKWQFVFWYEAPMLGQ